MKGLTMKNNNHPLSTDSLSQQLVDAFQSYDGRKSVTILAGLTGMPVASIFLLLLDDPEIKKLVTRMVNKHRMCTSCYASLDRDGICPRCERIHDVNLDSTG